MCVFVSKAIFARDLGSVQASMRIGRYLRVGVRERNKERCVEEKEIKNDMIEREKNIRVREKDDSEYKRERKIQGIE